MREQSRQGQYFPELLVYFFCFFFIGEFHQQLQAFGMMGWRTGYLAYQDEGNRLSDQLQKIQDTIPICPPQLSMHVALHAVNAGPTWVRERLSTLLGNR